MKGDKKVIQYLNAVLKNELAAINQYFLHSRMLEDWGVTKLARKEYEESIEEMQHADTLIKRVLFLGGLPNLQDLSKLFIGQSVQEILEADLKIEERACPELREAIAYCEEIQDYGSRNLFRQILEDEEHHIDYLETQLELVERIGIERYTLLNSDSAENSESE